ncbi:MAG: hypothetical protein WBO70_02660 [Erysipelotrichaceae bacterium]
MPWLATKIFKVNGLYGDVAGNWYELPTVNNHDFGNVDTIRYLNYTSTRYIKFFIACLYGEPGFTYTINRGLV